MLSSPIVASQQIGHPQDKLAPCPADEIITAQQAESMDDADTNTGKPKCLKTF
jgi:hypothetical protein